MTKANFTEEIRGMVIGLIKLVELECWNEINQPFSYIITNILDFTDKNGYPSREVRNKLNRKKEPVSLDSAVASLWSIFSNLYDINLYVYYAHDKGTLIEIQYYPKSALKEDFSETVKDNDPTFHSKVTLPSYRADDIEKFDVNWEYLNTQY